MSKEELVLDNNIALYNSIYNYQRKISSLMYAIVITRLDIAFAVLRLAWFITNLRVEHYKVANQVLNYLKGTCALAL